MSEADEVKPMYSPDETIDALKAHPEPHCLNHRLLLEAHELQHAMVVTLKSVEDRGQQTAHRVLAQYVQALYSLVSALPGSIRFNQLEFTVIKTGLVAPFIVDIDTATKAMVVGVPTTEAVADNAVELLVITASAFLCYWHYLNFKHHPETLPSDDCALMLTSLAIRSLSQADFPDAVDAELTAMGVEGLRAKHIRFLNHWVRSELLGWFAAVQYLLDDDRVQESLVAQQQDRLSLIKQVPDNPLGYLLYARSCLTFQQHKPAHVFATKGLTVCQEHDERICRPQLMVIQALSAALGGAGPTYVPRTQADVLVSARSALKEVTQWLPAPYHDLLTLGHEAAALSEWVLKIPEAEEPVDTEQPSTTQPPWESSPEEQSAVAACSDVPEACPEDPVYAMPAPNELPVGAITQLQQEVQAQRQREQGAGQAQAVAGGKAGKGSSKAAKKG